MALPNWLFDVALIYVFLMIVPDVIDHDENAPLSRFVVAFAFGLIMVIGLWR